MKFKLTLACLDKTTGTAIVAKALLLAVLWLESLNRLPILNVDAAGEVLCTFSQNGTTVFIAKMILFLLPRPKAATNATSNCSSNSVSPPRGTKR